MRESAYSFQMERAENIFLNIDAVQCGVGGNNSWGARALDPYRPLKTTYRYGYRLQPLSGGADAVGNLLLKQVETTPSNVGELAVPDL